MSVHPMDVSVQMWGSMNASVNNGGSFSSFSLSVFLPSLRAM